MKELTNREQIKVLFKACQYGTVSFIFGCLAGLLAWSYELQQYILNYATALNCGCFFGLVAFIMVIYMALYPTEKEPEYTDEQPVGFFDKKRIEKK